ncbi:MAG: hypothetical protein JNM79_15180 [Burkholderiales bacterium]|nr:hypothetical protein [Burkholderiales bacterium]
MGQLHDPPAVISTMSLRHVFLTLALLASAQAALAQAPRPGPGGPGFEERRAAREEMRREYRERREERMERMERREEQNAGRDAQGQRMPPDERRELRRQIRDHGHDIYRR